MHTNVEAELEQLSSEALRVETETGERDSRAT
jgi:hypothetical protein